MTALYHQATVSKGGVTNHPWITVVSLLDTDPGAEHWRGLASRLPRGGLPTNLKACRSSKSGRSYLNPSEAGEHSGHIVTHRLATESLVRK